MNVKLSLLCLGLVGWACSSGGTPAACIEDDLCNPACAEDPDCVGEGESEAESEAEGECMIAEAPCDDGNLCTTDDVCDGQGNCDGTDVTCDQPGGPDCYDASTLRASSAPGICAGGDCTYDHADSYCACGCAGDPGSADCVHGFTLEVADSGGSDDVGQYSSIGIDSTDRVFVSYYDLTNTNLKAAYRETNGTWTTVTVDSGSSGDWVGYGTSLALDSADDVHVVYYYSQYQYRLNYAHLPAGGDFTSGWTTETVSTAFVGGSFNAIAVDDTDGLHVSCWNNMADNYGLMYVHRAGGTWDDPITVDNGGTTNLGSHTSIAVGTTGALHVSYYDLTNGVLKYAYSPDGTTWDATTVDSSADVGRWTSLELNDITGEVHISYYDVTSGDLRLAIGAIDVGWDAQVLDGAGADVGEFSSMAFDEWGNAHVTYYDRTAGDLKYLHGTFGCFDLACAIYWDMPTALDETGDVGQYTSLRVDSAGVVHIAYYDVTGGDLKHAYGCP